LAHILVIDDDVLVRQSVRHALEHAGHSVIEAEDGTCALAMANEHAVDLILTDLLMPRCDGVETILGIRKAHPQMKILAMSGSLNQRHYLDLASKLGADAVLAKPFRPTQLREAITRLLS